MIEDPMECATASTPRPLEPEEGGTMTYTVIVTLALADAQDRHSSVEYRDNLAHCQAVFSGLPMSGSITGPPCRVCPSQARLL